MEAEYYYRPKLGEVTWLGELNTLKRDETYISLIENMIREDKEFRYSRVNTYTFNIRTMYSFYRGSLVIINSGYHKYKAILSFVVRGNERCITYDYDSYRKVGEFNRENVIS